ncbi:MAG: hypothetical protein ACRDCW_12145 [Sarcina sp.]
MANQQIDNIEDINEAINPITPPIDGQEGLEMLGHNRNQAVILSRFSRSFFKVYSHLIALYSSIKTLNSGKEDKFDKNSGFNREKTDLVENNTNKVFTAKGAFDLKTWLVTNYTTLMNNIRDTLTNMINLKLPHGGYGGSGQQLKNEIDGKINKLNGKAAGILEIEANNYSGLKFINSGNTDNIKHKQIEYDNLGRLYFITRDPSGTNNGAVYLSSGKDGELYHTGNPPTKGAVGLDLVYNWDATPAVNDPSNSKYATAGAVKKAYDKGVEALNSSNGKMNKGYIDTIGANDNSNPDFLKEMGVYYVGANGYQGVSAWSSIFNMSPNNAGYSNLQLSWYHGGAAIKNGGVKIRTISDQGNKSKFESLMIRNGLFEGAGALNAVNDSSEAWNQELDRVFSMMGGNNKMNFWVNSGFNARQGYIQVGHNDPGYASSLGTLNLNPLGGEVKALGHHVLTKGRMNRISPVVWSGSSYTAEFALPDGITWAEVLYIGCVGNNDSATLDGLFINSLSNGQTVLCGYVQGQGSDMATNFTKVSDRVGRFSQSGSGSSGGGDQTWPITRVFIRRID